MTGDLPQIAVAPGRADLPDDRGGFHIRPVPADTEPVTVGGLRAELRVLALHHERVLGLEKQVLQANRRAGVGEDLGRGADLFLCEATYQDHQESTFFHLSASEAAQHAAQADVRRLVLTHITPDLDPGTSLEQATHHFEGAIDVAIPDDQWEVGS